MRKIQILRLVSVVLSLTSGVVFPLKYLDLLKIDLPTIALGFAIPLNSLIDLYLNFAPGSPGGLNPRKWKDWLGVNVVIDLYCLAAIVLVVVPPFNDASLPFLLAGILASRHVWHIKRFLEEFEPSLQGRVVGEFLRVAL